MKKNLLLVFVALCIVHQAVSHGVLVQPTPRVGTNEGDGDKIKGSSSNGGSETCGQPDTTPGAILGTYQAGTTINVTWDTTIFHVSAPGVRIAIKYNADDQFADNLLASGLDVGPDGCHTTTVLLAAGKTCDNCVLQWMWESTADVGYYIGCSDIKIQTAPVPAGTNTNDHLNQVCFGAPAPTSGASSGGPNNNQGDGQTTGMTPGGKAALSLFIIGLFAGIVASVVFVKMGYGTIDTQFPFYHRINKKSGDAERAQGNYVAYADEN